jgi:hypothetical protein
MAFVNRRYFAELQRRMEGFDLESGLQEKRDEAAGGYLRLHRKERHLPKCAYEFVERRGGGLRA